MFYIGFIAFHFSFAELLFGFAAFVLHFNSIHSGFIAFHFAFIVSCLFFTSLHSVSIPVRFISDSFQIP